MDHEILETYPNDQGHVKFMRRPAPFPFWDRTFVLFIPPTREIDWCGKRAYFQLQKHTKHPLKPEGADGYVRAKNGGNFYVIIPDETKPDSACKLFFLSTNNYGGWLPNMEWLYKKLSPKAFEDFLGNIVEGYKKYFEKK